MAKRNSGLVDWCDTINNIDKYLPFNPKDLEDIKFRAEVAHASVGLNGAVLQLMADINDPEYELGVFDDRKQMCLLVQNWLKEEKGKQTMRLEAFQHFLYHKLNHPKANNNSESI
jgi:hypothetical protein